MTTQFVPTRMPTRRLSDAVLPRLTPTRAPTPDARICEDAQGSIWAFPTFSEILGQDVPVNVYLPPCYDSTRTAAYPLLVMLHGQGADEQQWINLGLTTAADALIANGEVPPLVIVMPRESDALKYSEDSRYKDALLEDLLPQWMRMFHISTERQYRAVGGLSRGANWAVRIAFSAPQAFGVVGAHSYTTFATDNAALKGWLEESSIAALPRLGFDVGEHDDYLKFSQPLIERMQGLGIPLEYIVQPGGHTATYWSQHVSDYLLWYSQGW